MTIVISFTCTIVKRNIKIYSMGGIDNQRLHIQNAQANTETSLHIKIRLNYFFKIRLLFSYTFTHILSLYQLKVTFK